MKIKSAKQAIKLGKFQKLQREINKFTRSIKKTPITLIAIMDAIIKIINQYPLEWENYEEISPIITIKTYE